MTQPSRILLAFAIAACAPIATTSSPAPVMKPAAARDTLPGVVRWTRASAEHRALFLEIYRGAEQQVDRASSGRVAGSWGVIMDADETVLDNSWYQQSRAEADSGFTDATWNAWVARAAAPALPGAAEFIRHVRSIGGHVVIVTNRGATGCPPTIANYRALALPVDTVLCRTTTGDKNPRFDAVQQGTAGMPAMQVLMWVGDNIQDFPGTTQAAMRSATDAAFADFGARFIALPNPMYGSWEQNPLP